MTSMIQRLGSANLFDKSLSQLTSRQSDLADQQAKLTAGKKVLRPSDDPTSAAQAERAHTRLNRIDIEKRALQIQRNAMSMAESSLGTANDTLKQVRDLVVSAGNAGFGPANRSAIATQLRGLRDQLLSLANQADTNGVPLFGGQGSDGAPFVDNGTNVSFKGNAAQSTATTTSIPSAMNGQAIWMNLPPGNGSFKVDLGSSNTGTAWSDVGRITDPAQITGAQYTITFSSAGSGTQYSVSATPAEAGLPTNVTYSAGQAIEFGGMSIRVQGQPSPGDTLQVAPTSTSNITNVFKVIDDAISSIDGAANSNRLSHATTRSISELDIAIDRIQTARGFAGDLLNRADSIENNQDVKAIQLESDRSRAEDIDMVKGISDFQNKQTAYSAALQTYAQVQKLSLFNFLG